MRDTELLISLVNYCERASFKIRSTTLTMADRDKTRLYNGETAMRHAGTTRLEQQLRSSRQLIICREGLSERVISYRRCVSNKLITFSPGS